MGDPVTFPNSMGEWVVTALGTGTAFIAFFKGIAWAMSRVLEGSRRLSVLDEITDREGWPNGASSLKESHRDIYEKAQDTYRRVAKVEERIATTQQRQEEIVSRISSIEVSMDNMSQQLEEWLSRN